MCLLEVVMCQKCRSSHFQSEGGKKFEHWTYLENTLQIFTYVSDWLYIIQCLISFSSIDHLLRLCARFLILFHLKQVRFSRSTHLLMFLSLQTLTSIIKTGLPVLDSGGTDRAIELCYNFSISNDLTQMVNFPTWIPDCDSHNSALLDLFLTSDASICSPMTLPPL